MIGIACIHTVYSVITPFTDQLRQAVGSDCLIHTMYDDFLATDPARIGEFSETNVERLRHDLTACEMTGAQVIVVSCSTLSPAVRRLRSEFKAPIVAIDDAMMKEAVRSGKKIGLLATANSTVQASTDALCAAAVEAGREISTKVLCDEEAIRLLKGGDRNGHDRRVMELAEQMRDCDTIVLAQASTAYMAPQIEKHLGIRTLCSPQGCIDQVCNILKKLNREE